MLFGASVASTRPYVSAQFRRLSGLIYYARRRKTAPPFLKGT
jgi:hypothetical protein